MNMNNESLKNKKRQIKEQKKNISVRTEAKALPQDASWRHVFLSFYLREVERAGKDEDIHEVDEAL